jgi:hypothetical protein
MGAASMRQKPKEANAGEAPRQHVQEESPEKFDGTDRHCPRLTAVPVVLPLKGDGAVSDVIDPMIRDGHAVRVARQVLQHMRGAAYAIQPGPGFTEAATLLGATFDGVIVRDGWAPNRRCTQAIHQTWLAHLLRRCRLLHTDHPQATFVGDVRAQLQQALTLRDRCHAGKARRGGRARPPARALESTAGAPRIGARCAALRRASRRRVPALFTFLWDPQPSMRPTGAPSRPRWSRVKSAGAIARGAGL